MKMISKWSRPNGLRCAIQARQANCHQCKRPMQWNQRVRSAESDCSDCAGNIYFIPHLFVLLGPDGNPVIGAAIGLSRNSCRSNICELLDYANLSHGFAAAWLTWSRCWIHHWVLISRHCQTCRNGQSHHSQWPGSPSSNPQWPELPELSAILCTVNHMPPAHHSMAWIQAFEDTYGQNPSNTSCR